jgi:ethanolamine-phosphate cytidylyltransferase
MTQQQLPKTLGPFNANPNFLASAKRIANFANTKEPLESDRIVYVDGSFDVCHPGHIEQLKKARQLGDFLIVGVHEDQTVNEYLGRHFPLNTLHERVLNVLACKFVDDVIIGAPFKLTERLLRDLNVSVVVKSLDATQGALLPTAAALEPYEAAAQLDMLTQVEVESPITVKEIIRRVHKNKEAIEKKVAKYSARQNDYETNATYTLEL